MKKLMWKREGFLDSLTFSGLAKVAIFTTPRSSHEVKC
jgi:hypothetical protein